MTRGCPFGTIGGEVTENDELIRQDLSLIFELVGNQLAAFFIREKAIGRISEAVDERQLADFCIATGAGPKQKHPQVFGGMQNVHLTPNPLLYSKELGCGYSPRWMCRRRYAAGWNACWRT